MPVNKSHFTKLKILYLLLTQNTPMRKLIFCLIIICSITASAQTKKTYSVEPGQKITDVIPTSAMYSYPEFKMGTVALRNGAVANVKLNYNSVFGEMQFIDAKGDTISLADEGNVKYVAVEKDTFYFNEGWLQVMDADAFMKIAKKRSLEIANRQKIGAMNMPVVGATETYNKFTNRQHQRDMVVQERITFTEHTTFYFGDKFNQFSKASKKSLLNLDRLQEGKIEAWLKENKIDYNKEEDLKKLFSFIQGQ